jgi:hypothetical protein
VALDAEILAVAAQAEKRSIQQRIRAIRDANTIRAYRALLLDADGELKPAALTVIEDLSRVAQLGRVVPAQVSDAHVREINGRRMIALHFIERIDLSGEKLRRLSTKLRESGHE